MSELKDAWMALENHWKIARNTDRISGDRSYGMMRWTLAPFFRMVLRVKIRGVENVPKTGPTILAANHLSHVDPILVIASSRRKVHYLAKDGHFKNFFLRKFMNLTGQIETQREEGGDLALASAADVLESNCALGIFPEGTRSKKTEKPFLLPGKTGIARLAASFPHSYVVPIALQGTRQMMAPQSDKLPKLWKPIKINYGKKISWLEWLSSSEGGDMSTEQIKAMAKLEKHEIKSSIAALYRKFTDQLMASIGELGAP